MARFTFRRTPRFDNLEGRQMLSSGTGRALRPAAVLAPVGQRSPDEPRGGSAQISSEITPQVSQTLQYYNVNLPDLAANDLVGHPAGTFGLECCSGNCGPGPEPVHGR